MDRKITGGHQRALLFHHPSLSFISQPQTWCKLSPSRSTSLMQLWRHCDRRLCKNFPQNAQFVLLNFLQFGYKSGDFYLNGENLFLKFRGQPYSPTYETLKLTFIHRDKNNHLLLQVLWCLTWYLLVELKGISQIFLFRRLNSVTFPMDSSTHLSSADSEASPLHSLRTQTKNSYNDT